MKSGISLFDKGIAKNLFRRYWPLWAAYLLLLLIMLPASMYSSAANRSDTIWLNEDILRSAQTLLYVSFAGAALSALAVFGFMYSSRSCSLICSMPVRRETVFVTATVMGLLPLLLSELLTFGVSALLLSGFEQIELRYLAQWLAVGLLSSTAFFGMAAFCAMLTGSAPVMPALFAVLNVAAYVAEGAVRALLGVFIYGFCYDRTGFTWLSPIVQMDTRMDVIPVYSEAGRAAQGMPEGFMLTGMDWLAGYCAAGIVLLALALLLFRRRRMETAGDVVALSILKPVFKYCMAFGGAVVFACIMNEWVFDNAAQGLLGAAVAAVMMLLGAAIGYYAAEMLMQKSLDVFRGNVKGCAIVCAVLLVTAAVCEFDLFGYETRVPAAEAVEYVELGFVDGNITEPENIQAVVDMHRQIIEHKSQNESAEDRYGLPVIYMLRDGSQLSRIYELDRSETAAEDPESDLMLWQRICNSPEVTGYRTSFGMPVNEDTLSYCNIVSSGLDDEGEYVGSQIKLDTDEALELYYECMLPDIADGHLAGYWAVPNNEYYDTKTNTTIYIELVDRENTQYEDKGKYASIDFEVQMDSERCLSWLAENTDIVPITLREAERYGKG